MLKSTCAQGEDAIESMAGLQFWEQHPCLIAMSSPQPLARSMPACKQSPTWLKLAATICDKSWKLSSSSAKVGHSVSEHPSAGQFAAAAGITSGGGGKTSGLGGGGKSSGGGGGGFDGGGLKTRGGGLDLGTGAGTLGTGEGFGAGDDLGGGE